MNASDFHLTSAEIHVWAIWLTAPDEVSNAYRALLGLEEIVRADKFAFENLKRRYEIAHGALRLLLARYLECPPCAVSFKIGPRSKPALKGDSALQFNLSHSVDLAVFAFAVGCELGVDVEQVREIKEMENIASRYFCEAEASDLSSIARSEVKKEEIERDRRCNGSASAFGKGKNAARKRTHRLQPARTRRFQRGNDRATQDALKTS